MAGGFCSVAELATAAVRSLRCSAPRSPSVLPCPLKGPSMGKQKVVSILVTLALLVAAGAAFALWPKHYTVGQRISETAVFWNNREAFLFPAKPKSAPAQNVLQ